jgi:hypothetical protein
MSLTDLNEELDVTFDHTEEQLSPATSPPTISEDHPVGTNREPELSKEAFVRRLKVPKTNTIVELSNLEKLEEFLQVGADADSFIFATSQVDDLEFIVVEGSIFVFNPPNQDLYNNSSRLSFRKSRNFRPLTLLGKTLSDYPISSFANIQQAVFKTAHHIQCYLNLHLIDPVQTQSGPKVKSIDVMTLMAAHNIARTQFVTLDVYRLWVNDELKKKHADHLLITLSRSPPMEPTSKKRKRDKDRIPPPKPQSLTLDYLSGLLYLLGLEEVIMRLSEGIVTAGEVHHRHPGHHDGTADEIKDRAAYIRAKSYYVVQSAGFKEHWPKGDLTVLPNSGGIRIWNQVLAKQVRVVYERFLSDMCNSAFTVSSRSTFFAVDIANEFYPAKNYALLINGEAADQTTKDSTIIKRSTVESQLYPSDLNESSLTSTSTTEEDIPTAAGFGSGQAEVPHPPAPPSSSRVGDQGTLEVDQQEHNQTETSLVFGGQGMPADPIAHHHGSDVATPGLEHDAVGLNPDVHVGTESQFAVSESLNSSPGSNADSDWFGSGMAQAPHPPTPPLFSRGGDQGPTEVDQQEHNQTETSLLLGDPSMPANPVAPYPWFDAGTYGQGQDENRLDPDIQLAIESELAISETPNNRTDVYYNSLSDSNEEPDEPRNADYSLTDHSLPDSDAEPDDPRDANYYAGTYGQGQDENRLDPDIQLAIESELAISETPNNRTDVYYNSLSDSNEEPDEPRNADYSLTDHSLPDSDAEPDDPRDADYSPSIESDRSADILAIDETDSQQAGQAAADLSDAESDTHSHYPGDGFLAEHVLEARECLNNDDIDCPDDNAEQDHQGGTEHGVSDDVDPLTVANILPLILKTRTRYPKMGTNGIACGNSQMKRGIKCKAYPDPEDDTFAHSSIYFEKPNSRAFEMCSPLANFYMPTLRSQQQCTTKKELLKCLKETPVRLKELFSEFHQSLSGTPNFASLKELILQFELLKQSYVEDMNQIAMLFSRIEYTYLFDPNDLQAPVPPFSDDCSPIHALRLGYMRSYQQQLDWFAEFNMAPLRKFASYSDRPELYSALSAQAKTGLLVVAETAVNLIAAGGGSKGSILGVCLNHSINKEDSFYRDHLWTVHPDFLTELTDFEKTTTRLQFGADPSLLSPQNRISWAANQESVTEPASGTVAPASDDTPHASYYELKRLSHKIRDKALYFTSSEHIYSRLLVDSLTLSGTPPFPAVSIFDRINFPNLSMGGPQAIDSLFRYVALQVVKVYRDEMAASVTCSLVKKVPSTSPQYGKLYQTLRTCHTKSSIDEFMNVFREITGMHSVWPFEGPDQSQPIRFDYPEVTDPGKELLVDYCTTKQTLILIGNTP